jgi:serine/threonine protein kinase
MYAHARGVLHKDLKPENLMLNAEDVLKIVDFGVALRLHENQPDSEYMEGTPAYMSPEQIHGLLLDVRTDVYSLGVTLYELLCGRSAYPLEMEPQDVLRHNPAPLDHLPEEIALCIERAMARDRKKRWRNAAEFHFAWRHAVEDYMEE